MKRWLAGDTVPGDAGLDDAVISVPGSTRDAKIYPLRTWRPVLEALRNPDWRDLSSVPRDSALFGPTYQHEQSLLRRKPPRATQLRDALNPGFSRGSLDRYRPAIRAQARALLGKVRRGEGSADLAGEWCEPLIAYAVTVTTGMTSSQWTGLRELTDTANAPILSPRDHAGMEQAQADLRDCYAPIIAGARAGLRAGCGQGPQSRTLVSGAVAVLDGLGLPPGEVVNTLQAFFGGFASAAPVLACMTLEALLLPEVLEQCHARPELVPAAVREHLRRSCHFTFAQPGIVRRHPIEAEGRVIQPGSVVIPMIHAAEHDPGRTPEPGRYDLFRPRRAILAFGAGVHHCPGRAWVELLLEEAFRALAEHRPRLVAPGTAHRGTGGLSPGAHTGIRIPVMAVSGPPSPGEATPALAWRGP
jgi:cytochrome P450